MTMQIHNAVNHKVGDLVRIQSKEWIDKQEKDTHGRVHPPSGFKYCLDTDMLAHGGEIAKIKHITGNGYVLDDINGCWIKGYWEDWMFDPNYNSADEVQGFCPACGDCMMTLVPTRIKDTYQCQVCGVVTKMIYRKFTIPANRCKSWRFTGKKRGWCSEHDKTCFGCEKWDKGSNMEGLK